MGDVEAEGLPPYEVQVTASFSLVEREPPPAPKAPPVEGEEADADADADAAPADEEAAPGIENVLFCFSRGVSPTRRLASSLAHRQRDRWQQPPL